LAAKVREQVAQIKLAVANDFFALREELVETLRLEGVEAQVLPSGHVSLAAVSRSSRELSKQVDAMIDARSTARKRRDFREADRIRDELADMGIALKDSKDPETGEIVTTWEVRASGPTESAP
jgi:cysteinyl-tRNA synthetase